MCRGAFLVIEVVLEVVLVGGLLARGTSMGRWVCYAMRWRGRVLGSQKCEVTFLYREILRRSSVGEILVF